jgi:hypothetical protein
MNLLVICVIYLIVALIVQTLIMYQQEVITDTVHAIAILVLAMCWPVLGLFIACLFPITLVSKLKKKIKK